MSSLPISGEGHIAPVMLTEACLQGVIRIDATDCFCLLLKRFGHEASGGKDWKDGETALDEKSLGLVASGSGDAQTSGHPDDSARFLLGSKLATQLDTRSLPL